MDKKTHFNIWYLLIAVMAILMLRNWWGEAQQVETVPYSEFQVLLEQDKVESISIAENYIRGTLRVPMQDGRTHIFTLRVDPDLAKELKNYNVSYTGVVESKFLSNLLSWVLPVLVFFGIWVFVFRKFAERQGYGGFMAVGKSKIGRAHV